LGEVVGGEKGITSKTGEGGRKTGSISKPPQLTREERGRAIGTVKKRLKVERGTKLRFRFHRRSGDRNPRKICADGAYFRKR